MMTPEQIVQVDQVIDLLRPDLAAVVWIMRDGSVETRGVRVSRAVLAQRLRAIADALDAKALRRPTVRDIEVLRHRRAARSVARATAEVWRRAGEALDRHRRMCELAVEVEELGHPADADRLRSLADKLLREATR